jgi:ribosomal protein S12 methylthiotransferase accessory factor YcaO
MLSDRRSTTTSDSSNGAVPESFVEHADYYARPENLHHVSFLFNSNDPDDREISHGGPNYSSLDARLRRLNRGIYVLDLTPPDVRELGAYVVKVIVPGLVPFTVGDQRCDELAASRLPTTIGRETISDGREFNRLPHPWP